MPTRPQPHQVWVKTSAEAVRGKQDDIFFVSPEQGMYANGQGDVFRTSDGGATWVKVASMPGTYWRATSGCSTRRWVFSATSAPTTSPR